MAEWMSDSKKNMKHTASVWDSEIPLTDYLKGKYVGVYGCFVCTK